VKGINFNTAFTNVYRRRIIIVPSDRLDYKGTVGTIIKWSSSSTDDVCKGNRRPINSRHTEDCHLQLDMYVCLHTRDIYNAFPTTVPAVLAACLLHFCFLCVVHELELIHHYVLESVQSCDASKQLLQGEKQQKFYTRGNIIAFCVPLFPNSYSFFNISWKIFYLSLYSSLIIS
jgi:hypothetical protein